MENGALYENPQKKEDSEVEEEHLDEIYEKYLMLTSDQQREMTNFCNHLMDNYDENFEKDLRDKINKLLKGNKNAA